MYLLTYVLSPWRRFLLEKLTGSQLVKKFTPHFMETKGSLPHSHVSATCTCPKCHSRSHARIYVSWRCHFSWWGVISTSPKTQAGGSPLVGCPRLLNIFAATLLTGDRSSIRNPKTRLAVVTGTHLSNYEQLQDYFVWVDSDVSMGVKLGRWHWGRKGSWGCLRIWCWGEYLDLGGTR